MRLSRESHHLEASTPKTWPMIHLHHFLPANWSVLEKHSRLSLRTGDFHRTLRLLLLEQWSSSQVRLTEKYILLPSLRSDPQFPSAKVPLFSILASVGPWSFSLWSRQSACKITKPLQVYYSIWFNSGVALLSGLDPVQARPISGLHRIFPSCSCKSISLASLVLCFP